MADFYTLVQKTDTSVVIIKNGKDRVFALNLGNRIESVTPSGTNEYVVTCVKTDKTREMVVVNVANGKARIVRRWKI